MAIKIYEKLNKAREEVRTGGYTKDGRNEYSKYDYFTPETVEKIVSEVCAKNKLLTVCNFLADQYGLYQELRLIDLEDTEEMVFILRTAMGEMKATNATQQMGGTDTYSERYLKMKVFQIKDNNVDPDSKDNTVQLGEKKLGRKDYNSKNKADFEAGKDPLDDEI
jgi:hypothetical protein